MKAWSSDFSATPIPLMCCTLYGEVCPVFLKCQVLLGYWPVLFFLNLNILQQAHLENRE
jgi:hypothetical protein